jgi:hypothetical protein
MNLAQVSQLTVVVPSLEGVTTAIVAFIFVCVVFPNVVKNKTQFYAAFAAVLLIILLHSLSAMIGTAGFQVFAGAATGLLQLIAVLMLFVGAGGISVKELGGEMSRAFEVIRRGEEEKTVIIPLTGERPKPRHEPAAPAPAPAGEPSMENIDLPPDAGWPSKKSDDSSIPLE